MKHNSSTKGCSKLKSPETRQVQERFVSTLEHMKQQMTTEKRRSIWGAYATGHAWLTRECIKPSNFLQKPCNR